MTTPTEICEQITALIVLNAAGALAPHSLGVSTRVLLNRSRALIAAQAVEIERLTARALAAEAALEKMREALKPFADIAEYDIGDSEADGDQFRQMPPKYAVAGVLTVGHLRRARAALTTQGGGE